MTNLHYLKIIEPKSFIQNFKTKEEFLDWLAIGTYQDLLATLEAFEDAELYEYCDLIQTEIIGLKKGRRNTL